MQVGKATRRTERDIALEAGSRLDRELAEGIGVETACGRQTGADTDLQAPDAFGVEAAIAIARQEPRAEPELGVPSDGAEGPPPGAGGRDVDQHELVEAHAVELREIAHARLQGADLAV